MRFNPPPNWPQPPADWTPPPGWEPDPSWPAPPAGWQPWISEDEFVISRHYATRSRTRPQGSQGSSSSLPWHRRTVTIVLFLVFFFPVGLVLLWLRPDWSVRRRGLVTAAVAIVVVIALPSTNPPTPTTTALRPTAVGATTSTPAPPAPAPSSQSARPSEATTASTPAASAPETSAAAAPVDTSAAVRTSAPAPVQTSATPVQTTTAPQPVQSTAQQSCYPLTNSGKCYKPGEYCRTADRGMTGIDAEGDPIKCEDNNGWRWEEV